MLFISCRLYTPICTEAWTRQKEAVSAFMIRNKTKKVVLNSNKLLAIWLDYLARNPISDELLTALTVVEQRQVLVMFIVDCYERKVTNDVITKTLNAIRTLLTANAADTFVFDDATLKLAKSQSLPSGRALNIIKQSRIQKLPVTYDMIEHIATQLTPTSTIDEYMVYIGIVLAFHFMMRVSEYCYDPENKHALLTRDVFYVCDDETILKPWKLRECLGNRKVDSMHFVIRSSKTDHRGKGRHLFMDRSNREESDIIDLLTSWALASRVIDALDPFLSRYRIVDDEPVSRLKLNRNMISSKLKETARYFKLDDIFFSSHSIRIGGATGGSAAGIASASLRRIGGWSANSTSQPGYELLTPKDHGVTQQVVNCADRLNAADMRRMSIGMNAVRTPHPSQPQK